MMNPDDLGREYAKQKQARADFLLGLPEGAATPETQAAVGDVERQVVNLPPETGLVPLQGPTNEPKIQKPTPQDRPDVPLRALPTVARAEFDEREVGAVDLLKQFGTGVVTGTEGLAAGVGGTIEAFGGFVSMIEEAADTPEGEGAGAFFEGIGADTRKMWQDEMQTTMLRDAQLWEGDFFENPSWQRASGLMGAAAPSLLAAMTTAKVTGNTTAAAALLGMLEGMPMYAEAREAGQGRAFALAAAGLATASITFLEKVGLDQIMKGGRGWVGRFMAGGAAEGITETAQTAVQNAIAHFGYDETRRLIEGLGDSLVAGAASGAPIAAMVGAKAAPGAVAEGATATDVIADALQKGIIDKPSHDIAQRLIALEEDVDGNLAVEIANVLKVASPEILEAQGIVPEAGQVFAVTGEHAPVINDGILQSTISLYKGADATTFVEEWYHRYLDNVQINDPESYDQIITLYAEAQKTGEVRSTQEWFGHQGRDWFMAERPDSPMAAILQKAKRGILKLVGVIQNVPGANIDPLLLDHFQKAGGAKPMDAKVAPAGVVETRQKGIGPSQQVGEYRGTHTAPSSDYGVPLNDMTGDIYPEDIYGPNAARYYGHGGDAESLAMDRATVHIFNGFRGKPDAEVTIYRAVPTDVDGDIRPGDWVTINKGYAESHGEGPLGGDYKIIEQKVKASEIYTNGDSFHEWGYQPLDTSAQVAGMSTGVGGWLSDVMGLETPGEITKAITAIYGDPDATVTIAGEQHLAGDLRQRYTIDVVSESYQVKPMRLKQQDGLTIADTLERVTANYADFINETIDKIDESGKIEATEEGGVLNLAHIDVTDETKALIAAGGFGIEAVEQILTTARRTMTPEKVMQSALENPMSLKDVLALPADAKINRETIFWVRFHHARVYDEFSRVVELAQQPIEDADTIQSIKDEIVKVGMLAIQVHQKRLQIGHEAGASLQYFANDISGREIALENLHNLLNQTAATGREVTADTFVNLVGSLTTPQQIENLLAGAQYPTWMEMIHEYWLFSILSGPKTQAVNIASNTVFLATNVVERQIAGLNPGQNVRFSEAAHMSWAMTTGLWDAFKAAGMALKTGRQEGTKAEDVNREPKITAKNVGGKLGVADFESTTFGKTFDFVSNWLFRGPFRGLATGDAFFRSLAHRAQFRALAIRQAHQNHASDVAEEVENPKTVQEYFDGFIGVGESDAVTEIARQDLMQQATDFADIVTFQKEMGAIGEGFAGLANKHILGRFILPFVRTPSNIIRETIKRSPLELASLANKESSLRRAIAEGGAERDLAIAQIGLGGAAMGMMMVAATSGFVTGAPPEDFKRRRALERLGYQWHSINVTAKVRGDATPQKGDTWVSYDRLDPIGSLVGMAVDATYIMGTTEAEDESVFVQLPTALVQALAVNVTSKTYLRGLSDFIQFMTDPTGWKATKFVKRQTVSFIPNILNQPGQAVDPYRREAEDLMEMAKMRSGFFGRQDLEPRLDRWGRKMEDNPWGFWGMFFPGYVKEARPNPVDEEIVRVMESGGEIQGLGVTAFDKINDVELTDVERSEYLGEAGKNAFSVLNSIFTKDAEALKNALESMAREAVKDTKFDGRKMRVSKKDAQRLVDAYYMDEKIEVTSPAVQTMLEQAKGLFISKMLKATRQVSEWNMMKRHDNLWDAKMMPAIELMYGLEGEPAFLTMFGISPSTLRRGIERAEGAREELIP